MGKWQLYRLPTDMTGKSFLDVGCWEGDCCVEAVRRNATRVVGVDLCTCESLRQNVETHGFEFVQMDILSEKFFQLDRFDLVLCSGVLYHVENVLSLVMRLRGITNELLILESAVNKLLGTEPILLFHPGDDLQGNPSNWWTPNEACLRAMLVASGFGNIQAIHRHDVDERIQRLCVYATPILRTSYEKMLPRKKELMSIHGGERDRKGPPVS